MLWHEFEGSCAIKICGACLAKPFIIGYKARYTNGKKYGTRSKILEAKIRQVVRLSAVNLATLQIAEIEGVNSNTVNNLDNAFIADRIVAELREAKISRQFLFATHNANIPVFGDAEWIGVFTAAENHGCLGLDAQGSIDVPTIRDQVANILEGGRSAFIQRKEKYEF